MPEPTHDTIGRESGLPPKAVAEPLRVLSLFAGIGGIDLGLESLGCETHWYSEVDPYACRVMALRFPQAQNLGDITEIDWTNTDAQPDIICGGFPCQDISYAGAGAGIAEGTRSGLWASYADAIRHLRPRLVIVENVSALLARGMGRVLGDLAAVGFDAEWDCIPAASVGAPHRRDRVFIIAYPHGSDGRAGAGEQRARRWPEPRHGAWWQAEPRVDRVANGVPDATHRLRCLGNAVVPQVAEHVGRIALERAGHHAA